MTSSLVFCSLLSLLIDPTFPKTCCSVFYVLWSSVNLSSMITDLLYMDQLESLWHDFKSPRVLNWCDLRQSIHFFFPPPQAVSSFKWCQTDFKILSQVSWDHGLNLLQVWSGGWRSYFCLHWAGEQTVIRKWDKSSGIDIYSSNVFPLKKNSCKLSILGFGGFKFFFFFFLQVEMKEKYDFFFSFLF